MGRKPYRTDCRFLKDDDQVSKVRWYEARPDAPCLHKTTIIYRREWDNDEYEPVPVGEVAGAAKRWLIGDAPVGLGFDHVCGTDEDFEEGGTNEPDLPEVRYGALGWPLCCDPPKRLVGGAASSGRSDYHVTYPGPRGGAAASGRSAYTHTLPNWLRGGGGASGRSDYEVLPGFNLYGGAGASGRAGFLVGPYLEPADGGYEIGGEMPDDYTPGTPTPGTDCFSAGLIELDTDYSHAYAAVGASNWWYFHPPTSGTYHVTTTGVDGIAETVLFVDTTDCDIITLQMPTEVGPPCWSWVAVAGHKQCLVFSRSSGSGTYTFRVGVGPC